MWTTSFGGLSSKKQGKSPTRKPEAPDDIVKKILIFNNKNIKMKTGVFQNREFIDTKKFRTLQNKEATMKRMILFLACLLTILGCGSLPERKTPDQTIAVLKINRVFLDNAYEVIPKPETYTPRDVVYITVDEDPKLYVLQQEYFQYMFTDLPPGPHRISSIQNCVVGSSASRGTLRPISIPFELKPGCITIINQSFNYTIQMNGQVICYYWESFDPLKPAERTAIVGKLSASSSFKTWELAE
jgi:hypothetical protein